ncbi:MAG: hypothetical protein PHP82_02165 [Candidatus ainarchaeum sp.]|nr:hypothetical protein [Candidatus ainarchaeum sp.]
MLKRKNKIFLSQNTQIKRNVKGAIGLSYSDPVERKGNYKKWLLTLFPEKFPKARKKMVKELEQQKDSEKKLKDSETILKERKKTREERQKLLEKNIKLKNALLKKRKKPKKSDLKMRQDTIETVEYVLKQVVNNKRSKTVLRRILRESPWAINEIRKRNPQLVEKAILLNRKKGVKK